MKKSLTIVVPAYNMEKFLRRCLDSLCVEEVMESVEVIIVNDGSRDNTLAIAKEFESKYPDYFIILDKQNGNYGSCMNKGLSVARGKYFRTLDADDWYDPLAYRDFVQSLSITDADMLLCERNEVFEDYIEEKRFDDSLPLNKDVPIEKKYWQNRSVRGLCHVSSICYKTSVLRDCGLKWSEKVFYSDNEYMFWPLKMVKTIRFISSPVYQYLRSREEQSTSPINIRKNFLSYSTVSNKILDEFLYVADKESPNYTFQLRVLSVDLLPYVYMTLFLDGKKNIKTIEGIEKKVCKNIDLFNLTDKIHNYRDLYYVRAFRNNKLKFMMIRLDYLVRSNSFLRRVLRVN